MIICSCNRLSDSDVHRLTGIAAEIVTVRQVYECLGCASRCGRCARSIGRIIEEALATCEHGRQPASAA